MAFPGRPEIRIIPALVLLFGFTKIKPSVAFGEFKVTSRIVVSEILSSNEAEADIETFALCTPLGNVLPDCALDSALKKTKNVSIAH